MHPMNPVLSGLLNGLSIGNMLRRSSMEEQQMRRQQEREARMAEIDDLKLAEMMQQAGIREAGPQDIVNRMTGTVQGTMPGQAGGSTGQFTEMQNPEIPPADGAQGPAQAQLPYLQAEINPGTLPQSVEVQDDNKYIKFRGKDMVVPGQRERIATSDAAKRRELRLKAEEASINRRMLGQPNTQISELLGLPADHLYLPEELKSFAETAGHITNNRNLVEERRLKREADTEARANPRLVIDNVTTDDGIFRVAVNPLTGKEVSREKVGNPRPYAKSESGAGAQNVPTAETGLTGQDYIKTLPKSFGSRIQAIIEGREAPPNGRAAMSGAGLQIMNAVYQADPQFNTQRAQVRKAFTTGPDGKSIGALNTAIVHLGRLAEAGSAMQNGAFVPGNQLYNYLRDKLGSEKVTNFGLLKDAVAGEMAAALKGSATDIEIEKMGHSIRVANSPAQMAGVVQKGIAILGDKANTYKERYQQQVPGDEWNPVLPSAQEVIEKHKASHGGRAPGAGAPPPIIQHSPSTGKYRHSLDGGKTWKEGRP